MKKFLLTFVFVLLIVAVGVATTFGWDNTLATAEEVTPTVNYIETEADFIAFINEGRYTANKYILTSDIYLDRLYAGGGKLSTTESGDDLLAFKGTFEGRGHAIVGLKEPLFDTIGEGAVIDNLQLIGVEGKAGSTLTSNPKYALAYLNKGTISGVYMTGEVEYSALVGTNSGTIQNSLAVIKRANMIESKETMLFAYENSGTINDENTYAYDVSNAKDCGSATWFFYPPNYVLVNLQLVLGQYNEINCGINLFNTPFVLPETMDNATIGVKLVDYIKPSCTAYYFNADYLPYEINYSYNLQEPYNTISNTEKRGDLIANGDGSKESPYQISDYLGLMALSTLEEGEYATLVSDINLDDYYLEGDNISYLIEKLDGHFDGNGHSITMGNFKNEGGERVRLFMDVNATGTVSDLFLNGYLVNNNIGTISNVTGVSATGYEYVDVNKAFIAFNEGEVIRSHAEGYAGIVGNNTAIGQIIYCSAKNNTFVVVNAGAVYGGYYEMTENGSYASLLDGNTFNLPNATECIGVNKVDAGNPVYVFTTDIDLATFPEVNAEGNKYLYSEAWAFGLTPQEGLEVYSWGYLNNQATDMPILIEPENRLAYKENLRFSEGYVDAKDYAYGKRNGHAIETINVSYLTKAIAEEKMTAGLSVDGRNYVTSKNVEWLYRANAYEEYASFSGDDFDIKGNYYYYLNDGLVYLEALATVSDEGITLEYSYVEKGVGLQTVIDTLGLRNDLATLYYDLGYTQNADTLLSYEEITMSMFTEEGDEIALDNLIALEGGKRYTVVLNFPSKESFSGTKMECYLNLTTGTLKDADSYKVESAIGGLEYESAPVYSGEDLVLNDAFSLVNFKIGAISSFEIISITRPDGTILTNGTETNVNSVRDAGKYSLRLWISVPGFEDASKDIDFYVERKSVEVYVKLGEEALDNVTINYYDELPKIGYYVDNTEVSSMNWGLTYDTDYARGSAVTGESEFYYVTAVVPSDPYVDPNHVIYKKDAKATIRVAPVQITLDEGAFSDLTLTYDGKEHAISLDGTKVNKNTAENGNIPYTVTYSYNEVESDIPYSFSEIGTYELSVKVISGSKNYLSSESSNATLIINKKAITVKASDVYVNYGEDAVYTIDVSVNDGVEMDFNVAELFILGTHYYVTCDYVAGETQSGATLPITLSALECDASLMGDLVNYDITWSDVKGTLTIGKKTYALDMITSYEYTGTNVEIDFNGEQVDCTLEFKKLFAGDETALVDAPVNACDSTFIYVVYITIPSSAEYYGTTDPEEAIHYTIKEGAIVKQEVEDGKIRKTFTITPKKVTLSGLYLTHNGASELLTNDKVVTYDKSAYQIDVNRTEFSGGGDAVFNFRYRVYGSTNYVESSSLISFTNAVKVSELSLTISGGKNYDLSFINGTKNDEDGSATITISSFEIAPRAVKLNVEDDNDTLVYVSSGYDVAYLEEKINGYGLIGENPLDNSGLISGDEVTISVSLLNGSDRIKNPTTHTVILTSNNPNYYLASSFGFTINSGETTLNLEDFDFGEFEYGELSATNPYVTVENFEFKVGSSAEMEDIKFLIQVDNTYNSNYLIPGSYSIAGVEPITGFVYGEEREFFRFNVVNVTNKIVVKPMRVTFDYLNMQSAGEGIKPTYTYGDSALKNLPNSVYKSQTVSLSGLPIADAPMINVKPYPANTVLKHVGEYTFRAEIGHKIVTGEGENDFVYCYELDPAVQEYSVKVTPRKVKIEVDTTTIFVGDDAPSLFTLRFPVSSEAPLSGDVLAYTYTVPGFDNSTEGEFAVNVTALVNDGGSYYSDYILEKMVSSAKELKVIYKEFDASLKASNVSETYTGYEILPLVEGLPDNARASFSLSPVNVGVYSVTVTVEMAKYRPKTFNCTVTITPATPTIQFSGNQSIPYDVNHTLGNDDVLAFVHLNGVEVEGEFYFMKTTGLLDAEYIRYGEYEYKIGFKPSSTNFNEIKGVAYKMTTYLQNDDYSLTANGGEVYSTITSEGPVTFTLATSSRVEGVLHMLVNGSNTYYSLTPNSYVVEESTESLYIDIMISDVSVYSILVNVEISVDEETPDNPAPDTPAPDEPGPGDEEGSGSNSDANQGGNGGGSTVMPPSSDNEGDKEQDDDEKSNLGLIIGLSVGGGVLVIAGVVVLVIFLVKKKGGKNE